MQERYSARRALERGGLPPHGIEDALRDVDRLIAMIRARVPFEEARARAEEAALGAAFAEIDLPLLPGDAAVWDLVCALIDYDPRPALERVRVPLLALFGGEDTVVPVDESVAVFRAAVRPELLRVEVFPGGDHRVQLGDPPRVAHGYLDALVDFVSEAVA